MQVFQAWDRPAQWEVPQVSEEEAGRGEEFCIGGFLLFSLPARVVLEIILLLVLINLDIFYFGWLLAAIASFSSAEFETEPVVGGLWAFPSARKSQGTAAGPLFRELCHGLCGWALGVVAGARLR